MTTSMNPGPQPNASSTLRGLVSKIAQSFAGAKTFLGLIVASAGVQAASLFNTNGGSAADVLLKLGTTLANGSVNADAKILSLRTGIGGTEVEKGYFLPDGTYSLAGGSVQFGTLVYGRGSWIFGNVSGGVGWMTSNFGAYLFQSTGTGQIFASHQFNGTSFAGGGFYGNAGAGVVFAGNNGGGASDIATKIGTTRAAASTDFFGAKLASFMAGIGGTEEESISIRRGGRIVSANGNNSIELSSLVALTADDGASMLLDGSARIESGSGYVAQLVGGGNAYAVIGNSNEEAAPEDTIVSFQFGIGPSDIEVAAINAAGRIDQRGYDQFSNVGAGNYSATNPLGRGAVESGNNKCTIMHPLYGDQTNTHVVITLQRDIGSMGFTSWHVEEVSGGGGFVLYLDGSSASGDVPFTWEIKRFIPSVSA